MERKFEIKSLPKSMAERTLWARQEFIKNPKNSQIDDECLIWCVNEEDNLWYSILGNYSGSSPEEKRLKEYERQKKYEEKEKTAIEIGENYYKNFLYQSEIRKKIFERDSWTCQLCGKIGDSKFHIHHVLKKIEGGEDFLDNLITCCPSCHKKADSSKYNPNWK